MISTIAPDLYKENTPSEIIPADVSYYPNDREGIMKMFSLPAQVEATIISNEGKIMLDVGCGDGRLGVALAKKHQKLLVELDVTDMRNSSLKNIPFIPLDRRRPPKIPEDLKADIIFLSDVMHHLQPYEGMDVNETPLAFLLELETHLNEKGKIIVTGSNQGFQSYKPKLIQLLSKYPPEVVENIIVI